jgi:hypothetical protein
MMICQRKPPLHGYDGTSTTHETPELHVSIEDLAGNIMNQKKKENSLYKISVQ